MELSERVKDNAIDNYIRQLQRSHGLTLQELASMLGYKSQTSLTRLMQDASTFDSLLKFADRLRTCTSLHLTSEESSQLYDLVELYDVGGDDYNVMLSLRRLLRGDPLIASGQLMLHTADGATHSFLAHYGSVRLRKMVIINCEQVPMYQDLSQLLTCGSFSIVHLLYSGGSNLHTVQSLHAAIPVLYSQAYSSYTYELKIDPQTTTRGLITSDIMLCDYEKDGQLFREIVVFTSPWIGEIHPLSSPISEFRRFFPREDQLLPVRLLLPDSTALGYQRFCAEMEQDCAVYRLKPDIGFDHIPPSLLEQVLSRHADNDYVPGTDEVKQLAAIVSQRQARIQNNTRPVYHIMKRSAMWHFVHTGQVIGHKQALLCLTVSERLETLLYIRDQLMPSGSYHLHFLKDDSVLRDDEFTLFEGKGLLILKAGVNFSEHKSDEIMITQPDFLKFFRRFLSESTLRHRVDTLEASAVTCDEMIEHLQHMT